MKKAFLVILMFCFMSSFAFAVPMEAKVVGVKGDRVTVKIKGSKLKRGDTIIVDVNGVKGGKDKKDEKPKKDKKPRPAGC